MRHGGVAVLLGVVAVAVAGGCTVVVPGTPVTPGTPPASADDATTAPTSTRPRTTTTTARAPSTSPTTRTAVDPEDYLTAPGYYHFTSASGKFACMISAEDPVLAGCHGPIPASAPRVPGSGAPDVPVAPNAVAVTADDKAAFMSVGDTLFQGFGDAAQPLPYGRSLTTAGFTCTVDPTTGVTCAARLHGFTVSDSAFDLW